MYHRMLPIVYPSSYIILYDPIARWAFTSFQHTQASVVIAETSDCRSRREHDTNGDEKLARARLSSYFDSQAPED